MTLLIKAGAYQGFLLNGFDKDFQNCSSLSLFFIQQFFDYCDNYFLFQLSDKFIFICLKINFKVYLANL